MALKEETIKLSEKIKDALVVDAGAVSEKEEGSIYAETLPEHMSIELRNEFQDHDALFNAAATKAVGDLGLEAMKKDSNLDRVTGHIKMGKHDSISMTVDREKTFKNHLKGGEEFTKYGVVSVNYEVRAGKNGGQLKAARTAISEAAAELLK